MFAMRMHFLFVCFLGLPLVFVQAQEIVEERPHVHVEEPTGRPIAPDPVPFTIGTGRFQLEFDALNYTRDSERAAGQKLRLRRWEWPITLIYGVRENLDLQLGLDAYIHQRVTGPGFRETDDGFGDLELRLKYNLWGNDGGDTAFALLPWLRLPTRQHGLTSRNVEGGLLAPFAMGLPAEFVFEWTPGLAVVRDADDDRYVAEFSSLAVVNRDITADVAWFVELESSITTESGDRWLGMARGGLTWQAKEHLVIEGGVGFGVTRATDDLNAFLTVVQRF